MAAISRNYPFIYLGGHNSAYSPPVSAISTFIRLRGKITLITGDVIALDYHTSKQLTRAILYIFCMHIVDYLSTPRLIHSITRPTPLVVSPTIANGTLRMPHRFQDVRCPLSIEIIDSRGSEGRSQNLNLRTGVVITPRTLADGNLAATGTSGQLNILVAWKDHTVRSF